MPSSAAAQQDSRHWIQYFQQNAARRPLPWDDPYRLSPGERRAVAHSIQQFQLGEGAQGRGFVRRAESYARDAGDPNFVGALRLFIAEEQRHSAHLARFMAQQNIPTLETYWMDTVFRRLRKFAGLEVCAGVLVSAELIALPYYRALCGATRSPLLRALCRRILRDEVYHLRFQAAMLARLRLRRTGPLRQISSALHRLFYIGTLTVVWIEHRPVFARAGYTFWRYFTECQRRFARFDAEIERLLSIFRRNTSPWTARLAADEHR